MAVSLSYGLLSSPRCGGYSASDEDSENHEPLSSPRCGGYSVVGVTLRPILHNLAVCTFFPALWGLLWADNERDQLINAFFPALWGLLYTRQITSCLYTFFPALWGLLCRELRETNRALLSSPRCGGYSQTIKNKISTFCFLPRVVGVTLCLCLLAKWQISFFPALRGLLLASIKLLPSKKLSSPRCGGHSYFQHCMPYKYRLSSPRCGGYSLSQKRLVVYDELASPH